MRVTQLDGGAFTSAAGLWRRGEDMERKVRFPIPAYLVEVGEERILVDTGLHPDAAADARRLACGAGLVPAVTGGASQPLDLGRGKRLFTETQRVALALRHSTCSADGCDRPYAWCELHHHDPWSHGGTTELANAVPLCGFHHRRIHDPRYHHRRTPGGALTFHRRT